nr:copia protein [Tanacetum cinerariifolium]
MLLRPHHAGFGDHVSRNNGASMSFKRFDYVDAQGNSKRGKITGKGKIRIGKLDFKDVYFVKELKFNLFSVSQMCDKKNSVLFTDTACVVLSSDFKLTDESHVLLEVPRKDNMYSVDLKNDVPLGGLTCLFAKATLDEYNLWHRRLRHVNFKTINNLVKGNLVRGKSCKRLREIFSKDSPGAGFKPSGDEEKKDVEDPGNKDSEVLSTEETRVNQEKDANVNSTNNINTVSPTDNAVGIEDPNMHDLEEISRFSDAKNDDSGADMNNLDTYFQDERGIVIKNKARLVAQGYTQEEGIDYDEVFALVARIKAIRLFLAYALFKDFVVYQINVKSAFLYGKIEMEVYVCQPPGFEDLNFPDIVYKVEKALYGLHQAPRSWKEMRIKFKKMMHKKLQMSSIGELTFFLGLQVKQKEDGIFISQDKKGCLEWNGKAVKDEIVYTSCINQVWTTAKVKNINGEAQIHATVDGKKVIISEASIRRDLRFGDKRGVDCFSTEVIFEQLTLIGYEKLTQKFTFYKAFFSSQWKFLIHTILQCLRAKTTAWNEFSSTIASAVICLATDQKFNFSKYIFDSMVKNLDSATKFLMFPRFVQLFLNNQLEEMANHTRIYVPPSHTKKIFGNTKRVGKGFSRRDTPLFPTMMVQAQEELGEDIAIPTETHPTPIITQPSSSQPSRKQKPRKIRVEDIFGVNDQDDTLMFDANKDLQGEEVVVEKEVAGKYVSVVKEINAASIETFVTTTTLTISMDETTLAKALIEIKTSRPKAKGIVMQEPSETPTPTPIVSSQQPSKVQDKDKGIMVEPEMPLKKKAQISLDEEFAFKLQAEKDEHERIRLHDKEQEQLTDAEKSRLFMEFLEKKRKFFAAKRNKEKRNRPPTKAQQRSIMSTYLKNMDGWKPRALKNKSFAKIKELFDKAMERINNFVNFKTEVVEESTKKDMVETPTAMTWHATWQVNVRSAGGQHWSTTIGPPVNDGGQRWRSTVNGGDRWSMMAINDGCRWRTIVDHCRTIVYHHQTTGQWWLTDSQPAGHRSGQVGSWAGSGSGHGLGLDRVMGQKIRDEMPLPEVCTAIEEKKKKLPVKDRWQLH